MPKCYLITLIKANVQYNYCELNKYNYYRACVAKLYIGVEILLSSSSTKMLKFFVYEDIGLKLGTAMYHGFLSNIARNIFFQKLIFFDLLTLL